MPTRTNKFNLQLTASIWKVLKCAVRGQGAGGAPGGGASRLVLWVLPPTGRGALMYW